MAWASAAAAQDAVKPGRWEFSATVPGATQLPRGVRSSPGVQVGPEGVTFTRTGCITAADPLPPMARGRSVSLDADHPCKIEKIGVAAGTVRWTTTCATPQVTIREEGTVHYHGETSDGEIRLDATGSDHPAVERAQQLKGRYLGPCETR